MDRIENSRLLILSTLTAGMHNLRTYMGENLHKNCRNL